MSNRSTRGRNHLSASSRRFQNVTGELNAEIERFQAVATAFVERITNRTIDRPAAAAPVEEPLSIERIFRDAGILNPQNNVRSIRGRGLDLDADSDGDVEVVDEIIINPPVIRHQSPPRRIDFPRRTINFFDRELEMPRIPQRRPLIPPRRPGNDVSHLQEDNDVAFKKLRSELEKALRKISELEKNVTTKEEDYQILKRKYDLKVKECDDLKEKYKNIPPRFAKIRKVDPQ